MQRQENINLLLSLGAAALIITIISWLVSKRNPRPIRTISATPFWQETTQQAIQANDIDLFSGQRLSTQNTRYNSVIPDNAISHAGHYLQPFRKKLNVSRLEKAHIVDVLHGNYLQVENSPENVLLEDVIKKVEQNVCAISQGKGQPFATGILIALNLIFTARHCVENIPIKSISIRSNYQLETHGMNYGESYDVQGVIEDNEELDYAIVQLTHPVKNFQPVNFNFTDNVLGNAIFIHHPDGCAKKVSVHATSESDLQQFSYSGFHDSSQGSSGSVYIDEESRIFALHLLFSSGTTGARWIKNIYANSPLLRMLFTQNGNYTPRLIPKITPKDFLPISNFSKRHHADLEKKLSSIMPLPPLNKLLNVNQSRHHIIPDGDMQFLWLIGQECPKLQQLLSTMAYQCGSDTTTINAMEWAPWNLFIGPSGEHRKDDPGGDSAEKTRPASFDEKLWIVLHKLHALLNECWQARYVLSTHLKKTDAQSTKQFRSEEIESFFQYDTQSTVNSNNTLLQTTASSSLNGLKQQYSEKLNALKSCLKSIQQEYLRISQKNSVPSNYIHQTVADDWEMKQNKFFVKQTSHSRLTMRKQ